jgi:hypothetical protein
LSAKAAAMFEEGQGIVTVVLVSMVCWQGYDYPLIWIIIVLFPRMKGLNRLRISVSGTKDAIASGL